MFVIRTVRSKYSITCISRSFYILLCSFIYVYTNYCSNAYTNICNAMSNCTKIKYENTVLILVVLFYVYICIYAHVSYIQSCDTAEKGRHMWASWYIAGANDYFASIAVYLNFRVEPLIHSYSGGVHAVCINRRRVCVNILRCYEICIAYIDIVITNMDSHVDSYVIIKQRFLY